MFIFDILNDIAMAHISHPTEVQDCVEYRNNRNALKCASVYFGFYQEYYCPVGSTLSGSCPRSGSQPQCVAATVVPVMDGHH